MDVEELTESPLGRTVPIGVREPAGGDDQQVVRHAAYVPDPLPDELQLTDRTRQLTEQTEAALARLDEAAGELADPRSVVRPIVRREAVSTSALAGIEASIDELLEAESVRAGGGPATRRIVNYVQAVDRGRELIEDHALDVTMVNELHQVLLHEVGTDGHRIGHPRDHQTWIGAPDGPVTEARFVPPPPGYLPDALVLWEQWIHRPDVPVVVRAALGHYQFEALHPYPDGNGRLGRLIAVLQLIQGGLLRDHLLALSPAVERHHDDYLAQLQDLPRTGDLDAWVQLFARVLREAAEDGLERLRRLQQVRDEAVERLRSAGGRDAAVQIAGDLLGYPAVTVSEAAERAGVGYQAASEGIDELVEHGILTGDDRDFNRVYYAQEILAVLRREEERAG